MGLIKKLSGVGSGEEGSFECNSFLNSFDES